MAISGRDCSQSVVKKVPSSSKKKKNTTNQSEEESYRSKSISHQNKSSKSRSIQNPPISTTKKKSAAVFPISLTEDIDNNDEFGNKKAFNGEEGMWLSSDNTSISSYFEDQSTISDLFCFFDESIFSNSFSNEGTTFFDGSMIYPAEQASSPLKTRRSILDTEKTFDEDVEGEQEIVNWLLSSADNDHTTEHVSDSGTASTPLFWPFQRECDWSSINIEAYDGFCMSPLNDTSKTRVRTLKGSASCRRRLVFSSETLKSKENSRSSTETTTTTTTRRSRAGKALKEVVDMETEVSNERLVEKEFWSSIEKIVGLCEFDGHEGVENDFNKDEFVMQWTLLMCCL